MLAFCYARSMNYNREILFLMDNILILVIESTLIITNNQYSFLIHNNYPKINLLNVDKRLIKIVIGDLLFR